MTYSKSWSLCALAVTFLNGVVPTPMLAKPAAGSFPVYVGISLLPLEITGVDDVELSDWQYWGTGSAEGRIKLPLKKGVGAATLLGLGMGVEWISGRGFGVPLDLDAGFGGGKSLFRIQTGLNVRAMDFGPFELILSPKIGMAVASIGLGTAVEIPGKSEVVLLPEASYFAGDNLSAQATGLSTELSLIVAYWLTPASALRLSAGYTQGFFGGFSIKSGETELALDSPAVVQSGTVQAAGLNPRVTMGGLTANLSWMWSW